MNASFISRLVAKTSRSIMFSLGQDLVLSFFAFSCLFVMFMALMVKFAVTYQSDP